MQYTQLVRGWFCPFGVSSFLSFHRWFLNRNHRLTTRPTFFFCYLWDVIDFSFTLSFHSMQLDWKDIDRFFFGSAWTDARIGERVQMLCEEIGPRWATSPQELRAAQYIRGQFAEEGLEEVELEEFELATYEYDKAEAVLVGRDLSIDLVPRRFQWYIAEGMLSLPTAKWSMVISFFSGVMASGFAFGCAKDTVEFFNAGIGEVRFPVGEGFLLVIFDYVGPWV